MDDNALMARVQAGDMQAFDTLVLRHYDAALRLARSLLHDDALGEDAVQEAFADLYARRDLYRATFAFTTYLRALVRHKSIDLARRRRRLFRMTEDLRADVPMSEADTPEARAIAGAFAGGLMRCIDELPGPARDMLIAYALEGKSYQAIAKQADCSVSQVKSILHRARRRLRKMKEEWQ